MSPGDYVIVVLENLADVPVERACTGLLLASDSPNQQCCYCCGLTTIVSLHPQFNLALRCQIHGSRYRVETAAGWNTQQVPRIHARHLPVDTVGPTRAMVEGARSASQANSCACTFGVSEMHGARIHHLVHEMARCET